METEKNKKELYKMSKEQLKSDKPYIFIELDKKDHKINIDTNSIENADFYLMLGEYINYYKDTTKEDMGEIVLKLLNTIYKIYDAEK